MTRAFLRCTVVLVLATVAAIAPATAQFPPAPPTFAPPRNAPPPAGTPKKKAMPPGPSIAGNWSGQLTQVDNQTPYKFEHLPTRTARHAMFLRGACGRVWANHDDRFDSLVPSANRR